jgi:transcriptional regulator with XRE-family HTH domain
MTDRAERDPGLDDWQARIAEEIRMYMAAKRLTSADAAKQLGMKEAAFSRRLNGYVSFKGEELLWLADWMDRNIDEIMAAAKRGGMTNLCLSQSESADAGRLRTWARRGYELAARIYGQRDSDPLDGIMSAA